MSEYFFVCFKTGTCFLNRAESLLKDYGLDVKRVRDSLMVGGSGNPEFLISLTSGEDVLNEAKEIGAGTEFENELNECGSRFEVTISDFESAIDEINTMMEVQVALQEASHGFLFLSWNSQLSPPEQD